MNLVYEGKTKDVYALNDGEYLLKFKDDVTGEDGKFDPGANTVGLSIEGMGKGGIKLTSFFFQKLAAAGIPTHFISADVENSTVTVKRAEVFGNGLEIICRFKAVGSFMKRYGDYATEGQDLDAFVEITLKSDERGDPPISKDALIMLGILKEGEYEALEALTKKISTFVKDELKKKGADLYDIKLEFGRVNGEVALIDEITGGNMRVYKDGVIMDPLDIVTLMVG